MASFEKRSFSRNSPVNFPAESDNIVVHDIVGTSGVYDEIWLWISNPNSTSVTFKLRLQNQGTGTYVGNFAWDQALAANETMLVLSGIPLNAYGAAGTALVVEASNYVYAYGYVNRITP